MFQEQVMGVSSGGLASSNLELVEFLVVEYFEKTFLNGLLPESDHPLADELERRLYPEGAHLVTMRACGLYYHHGLYCGDNKVIHYSGFSKPGVAGKVEEVPLHGKEGFSREYSFHVIEHPNPKYGPQKAIARARERLGEDKYSLFFNNCEHFVNYCIDGVPACRQNRRVAMALPTSIKTAIKGKPVKSIPVAGYIVDSGMAFADYLAGKIDGAALKRRLAEGAIANTSAFYYSALGQAFIPVPVLGALVGGVVGYWVGSILSQSAYISLTESAAVKAARERREKVEKFVERAIPIIQESRHRLAELIDRYLYEQKRYFDQALKVIDNALNSRDVSRFEAGLKRLGALFDENLRFASFDDFNTDMLSEGSFRL